MHLAPCNLGSALCVQAAVLQHNVLRVSTCGGHRSAGALVTGSARLQCQWPCCSTGPPADGASQGDERGEPTGSSPAEPLTQSEQDWREFRANLVARESTAAKSSGDASLQLVGDVQWAHRLASPEPGCLLIGRQPGMGVFERAVILVLEHDDRRGSVGLIMNLASPLLVNEVAWQLPAVKGVFGNRRLYLGGPMQTDRMHVVHMQPGISGATGILPGIFVGGMEDLLEKVLSGEGSASGVRLLAGICGWGAYQLSSEILDESWWVVSASGNTVQDLITTAADERASELTRDMLWLNMVSLAQIQLDE